MRHAMGVAVFSGMLGVTFFSLLLTPVFYVLLGGGKACREKLRGWRQSIKYRRALSCCR
jgi:hypothetical protein